jgi:hypothetical protein
MTLTLLCCARRVQGLTRILKHLLWAGPVAEEERDPWWLSNKEGEQMGHMLQAPKETF